MGRRGIECCFGVQCIMTVRSRPPCYCVFLVYGFSGVYDESKLLNQNHTSQCILGITTLLHFPAAALAAASFSLFLCRYLSLALLMSFSVF